MMRTTNVFKHPMKLKTVLAIAASLFAFNSQAKPEIGGISPDFTLPSNGQYNLRLSEQRGYVVVAVFWTTWCGECSQFLRSLSPLKQRFGDFGTLFWTINLDKPNAVAKAMDLYSSLGIDYPVLLDSTFRVSERYDIGSLPAIVVIDRDGVLRYQHDGLDKQSLSELEQQLQTMVSE